MIESFHYRDRRRDSSTQGRMRFFATFARFCFATLAVKGFHQTVPYTMMRHRDDPSHLRWFEDCLSSRHCRFGALERPARSAKTGLNPKKSMSFGELGGSPKCTVRKRKLELQFQKAGDPVTRSDSWGPMGGSTTNSASVRKQLATGCRHLCEEGGARNLGQVPGTAQ